MNERCKMDTASSGSGYVGTIIAAAIIYFMFAVGFSGMFEKAGIK